MQVMQQPEVEQFICDLRQRLKLTQEELAAELGVTFATVNCWENRHTTPSRLAMRQIENLLRQMGDRGQELLAKHFQQDIG